MYSVRIVTKVPGFEEFDKPIEFETNENLKTIYKRMISHLRAVYKSGDATTRYIVRDETGFCIFWGFVRTNIAGFRIARLNGCGKYGNYTFDW